MRFGNIVHVMPQPPKCRQCGVAEWNHLCAGAVVPTDKMVRHASPPVRAKPIARETIAQAKASVAPSLAGNRREYMRQYKADSRAAAKAGISVKEYRERNNGN